MTTFWIYFTEQEQSGNLPIFLGPDPNLLVPEPKANAVEWVGSCNKGRKLKFLRKSLRFVCPKSRAFCPIKSCYCADKAFVWRTKLEQMNVELEHVAASSALKKRPVWHQVILQNVLAVWNLRIMAFAAIGQIRYAKPSLKNTSSDHYLI